MGTKTLLVEQGVGQYPNVKQSDACNQFGME